MSETVYKAKKPFKQDGKGYYPITTFDQIIMPDNNRWDGQHLSSDVRDEAMEVGSLKVNADLLGGVAAANYALKEDLDFVGLKSDEREGNVGETIEEVPIVADNSNMLGGKAPEYYIQPRNLLDNSDFCNVINQRGKKNYDGTDYAFDRWRVWDKDTVTVNEQGADYNGITVSGVLFQYLEKACAKNTTYTLAVCLTDGTIRVISRNPKADYWFNDESQLGLGVDNNVIVVALGSGTYRWAALYEGAYTAETLPPYTPKGYAAELAECHRYFRSLFGNESYEYLYMGQAFSATGGVVIVPIEVPMRVKPTLTKSGTISVTNSAGNVDSAPVTSLSVAKAKDNALSLLYAASGQTTGQATILTKQSVDGYVYLSADL